jgi:Mn2+/Fe2+ NRAMP family transporter
MLAAMQMMCARIGLVSRQDLASAMREHYPRWVLRMSCLLLLAANWVTIAADIGGVTAGLELLTGLASLWFVVPVVAFILGLLIFRNYAFIEASLKWLTLFVLAYIVAGVLAHADWWAVLKATVIPRFETSRDYLVTFVGLFGTTITPPLFFWQSAMEVEKRKTGDGRVPRHPPAVVEREMRTIRTDTASGMILLQVICYFAIVTAGATLYSAHAINGLRNWRQGLNDPPARAKAFYTVIILRPLYRSAHDRQRVVAGWVVDPLKDLRGYPKISFCRSISLRNRFSDRL